MSTASGHRVLGSELPQPESFSLYFTTSSFDLPTSSFLNAESMVPTTSKKIPHGLTNSGPQHFRVPQRTLTQLSCSMFTRPYPATFHHAFCIQSLFHCHPARSFVAATYHTTSLHYMLHRAASDVFDASCTRFLQPLFFLYQATPFLAHILPCCACGQETVQWQDREARITLERRRTSLFTNAPTIGAPHHYNFSS